MKILIFMYDIYVFSNNKEKEILPPLPLGHPDKKYILLNFFE